jgi:hypothetical protein
VMVVFNDPVPVEKPALQAVLMALEVRNAIGALTAPGAASGTRLDLASASRTDLRHSVQSALKVASTMPLSVLCPMSPPVFAMRPSQDKSSSARVC